MYWPKPGSKRDLKKRWQKPDRIFFGFGACHILCGAYLKWPPLEGFYAEQILPASGFPGSHIYATDGVVSFDYHGYALRENLLRHYEAGWQARYPGWTGRIELVDFDLLDTTALNMRKFWGPDQYPGDALKRAYNSIARIDHVTARNKALQTRPRNAVIDRPAAAS
ncbi:hypothetical protein KQ247_15715 [Ruegeria pomeroyi]|jgi:hypothetical protein|uniref:Uncharacterized protein n=2 Tax=Ruegeria pomeroyi TaxID=89184 RepID=Q5LTN3_RUEPO|nr:hypothetical protein [Ruegeria pomeroyi]HCE70884.1 hypothetical protein [Ruegeria sp.]AAV94668.1 hypothetical protein SPO1380 [Ruegeria pomeroyi DSS-3]NVK95798.1 hypothetical protein [Ruegeria pomeroyi]NVL00044.1 hypothetical protein [Ruegeria pomeroyi]QWV08251.1 hypothetical protein KQ247_15715 [Ruegeria pomeroyi]